MYMLWIVITSLVTASLIWQIWRLRVALASKRWPSIQSQLLDVKISEERESEGGRCDIAFLGLSLFGAAILGFGIVSQH